MYSHWDYLFMIKMFVNLLGHIRRSSLHRSHSNQFQNADSNNRGRGIASASAINKKGMPKNPSLIKNVLLAVDPDTRGAIAYCSWIAQDDQKDAVVDFTSLSLKVFDMPCASVQLVKKLKSGKQAVRR